MPIYEFKCKDCEKTEEFLLKFSDPKPTACTFCGGEVAQLISQTSFALKGAGWYVTDYKPQPKDTPAAKPATAETKTEAAPATTSTPGQTSQATPASTSTQAPAT